MAYAAQESGGPLETANWSYYDTTADPATHRVALGGNGWIGALEQESVATSGTAIGYATAHSANSTTHYYDAKGRPHIDLNNIDGTWFYTYTDYTEPNGTDLNRVNRVQYYWRPSVGTDPGRSQILAGSLAPYSWRSFGYTYSYDSKSYVLKIADTNPASRTWWQADATAGYDELDRPVKVSKGGLLTTRTYRKSDGVLTNIVTTGGSTLQNFTYTYDELGNLKSRKDNVHATVPTETLGYDGLNRLTTDAEGTISYFPNGNIQSKPDVNRSNPPANFTYDLPQPHAVHTAWGYTMGYDANGNVNSRSKSGETWKFKYAGFDKPRWMTKVAGSTTVGSEFLYNADHSRVLHLEFDAANGTTGEPTHYVRKRIYGLGSTLEADYQNNAAAGQTPDWQSKATRIYVPGPDGTVGTEEFTPSTTVQGGLTETAHIYHYDHLGSIQAITVLSDSSGNPAVTDPDNKTGLYSEDAWGARRNPLTWSGAPATTTDAGGSASLTPRGFTGHEMLDDLGLVHMNGRIYDPLLGRMLSADVAVQHPNILQSYNLYSYVRNNPLTLVDPSGWQDEAADSPEKAIESGFVSPEFVEAEKKAEIAWGLRPAAEPGGGPADAEFRAAPQPGEHPHVDPLAAAFADALARGDQKELDRLTELLQHGPLPPGIEPKSADGKIDDKVPADVGRTGKQQRLRELADDPNVSSAVRGWIRQEMNSIKRGKRDTIRVPPGMVLAHERGREAAKGFSYEFSNLVDRILHKIQHTFDDFGRRNKPRPPSPPPPPPQRPPPAPEQPPPEPPPPPSPQ